MIFIYSLLIYDNKKHIRKKDGTMDDMALFMGMGLILFLLGFFLFKRENLIFKDSITTKAKVSAYYDYINRDGGHPITMYTMAVEYALEDGRIISAREQQGSSVQGFPIGTDITITYSRAKPDFFILQGDNSRRNIFIGMMVFGLFMFLACIYFGIKTYYM